MSTYVITGASRGIGFGILSYASKNRDNLVIGLVRNKAAAEKKVADELAGRSNIHILVGDLDKAETLRKAAAASSSIVGDRGVDYLIANAGSTSAWDQFDLIGDLAGNEEMETVATQFFKTGVIGNTHLFAAFVPLLQKGKIKKAIAVSSGHAALDIINAVGLENAAFYAAAKAAQNIIVAKFSVQYKDEGILFMSVSPGVVDTGMLNQATEKQLATFQKMGQKFVAHYPLFKGPMTVEECVPRLVAMWERASIESGYAGAFVSHWGNNSWL